MKSKLVPLDISVLMGRWNYVLLVPMEMLLVYHHPCVQDYVL